MDITSHTTPRCPGQSWQHAEGRGGGVWLGDPSEGAHSEGPGLQTWCASVSSSDLCLINQVLNYLPVSEKQRIHVALCAQCLAKGAQLSFTLVFHDFDLLGASC